MGAGHITDLSPGIPVWRRPIPSPAQGPLRSDAASDICVVGAGIAGMTTAYLLAREGNSVIVLDEAAAGRGDTGRTSAHLTYALDGYYCALERLHGNEGARLAAQSHAEAIERVRRIVAEEGIDCDLKDVDGYLFAHPGGDPALLERELNAARRAGLEEVEAAARAPLRGFDTGFCLRFPRQAQLHPMLYLTGLAQALERLGGRIYTGTRARRVEGGSQARVLTDSGATVSSAVVVLATNWPVPGRAIVHGKLTAYRTYAIAARAPRGAVAEALYWDTADPYHYARTQRIRADPARDMLIVGGEDHRSDEPQHDTAQRYLRLERWMRERFPSARGVEYRWSGRIMEPVDGLAFIGPNPMDHPNVYIATGYSGNGMTHGTIAGILLRDLILGQKNSWASIYDPSRLTLRAAKDFFPVALGAAGS